MLTTGSHVWNLSRLFLGDTGKLIPSPVANIVVGPMRAAAYSVARTPLVFATFVLCLCEPGAFAASESPDKGMDAATAFKKFIESPPIIKSLRARFSVRTESYRLLPEEIAKPLLLAQKLRDSTESDSITYYLRTNLTAPVLELISTNDLSSVRAQLPAALAKDLNRLLPARPLFEAMRFEGIQIPLAIQNVVGRHDQGLDLPRINRALLHAAFPVEIPADGHIVTNYIFTEIRYQPGAAFFRSAISLDDLDRNAVVPLSRIDRVDGYPPIACIAAGYYGSNFWCIGNSTYQKDQLSDSLLLAYSKSNRNPVTVQSALFAMTRIMNMGLPSEKLGGIRWENNVANSVDRLGNEFYATLNLDPMGKPRSTIIQRKVGSQQTTETLAGRTEYYYSTNISGWALPSKIVLENTNWIIDLLSAEVANKPGAEEVFSAQPFINRNSYLMLISTKADEKQISSTAYDDFRFGMRKFIGRWVSKDAIRSRVQFFYCALTLCFVSVGLAVDYKEKQKASKKENLMNES